MIGDGINDAGAIMADVGIAVCSTLSDAASPQTFFAQLVKTTSAKTQRVISKSSSEADLRL